MEMSIFEKWKIGCFLITSFYFMLTVFEVFDVSFQGKSDWISKFCLCEGEIDRSKQLRKIVKDYFYLELHRCFVL